MVLSNNTQLMNDRQEDGHNFKMENRKSVNITGVKQVDSFDNEEFLLVTTMGYLTIRGMNLQMSNLDVDRGIVSIKGKVNEIIYSDQEHKKDKKSFLGKIFK